MAGGRRTVTGLAAALLPAMVSTTGQGGTWAIITAPLVVTFLLFQRRFAQGFMRARGE